MESTTLKSGAVIGNVGIVDLREATDETISRIKRIGNVGTILYAPNTASLIGRVAIGNIGAMIEVPDDAQLQSGPMTITRDTFRDQKTPQFLVVLGPLTIEGDVQASDFEAGLSGMIVSGPVIYPETIGGALQSKLKKVVGPMLAYPVDRPVRTQIGNITVDEAFLASLEDGTTLVAIGNTDFPSVLPDTLLELKIGRIILLGNLECHEENAAVILSRMDPHRAMGNIERIPAGHERIDRALHLDTFRMESMTGQKLFCKGRVIIAPDVTPEALEAGLASLVAKRLVLCPVALKTVLASKCDPVATKIVYYDGTLWLIDQARTLNASRFTFLEGNATLVVTGSLTVEPDVDPRLLFERLSKVHNLGTITCTSEQMGALQARLGQDEGSFGLPGDDEEKQEEAEQASAIGNVGYLKL